MADQPSDKPQEGGDQAAGDANKKMSQEATEKPDTQPSTPQGDNQSSQQQGDNQSAQEPAGAQQVKSGDYSIKFWSKPAPEQKK